MNIEMSGLLISYPMIPPSAKNLSVYAFGYLLGEVIVVLAAV